MPGVEVCDKSYFGFVYLWCDIERNMFYIGSHKGSIHDNYICSSEWCRRAIKKRPNTFKRVILGYANDKKSLFALEERYLKFYSVDLSRHFYNFKSTANGGSGPSTTKGKSRKETCGPDYIDPRRGKTHIEIYGVEEAERKKKISADRIAAYFAKHGHGYRKGKKATKPDVRLGKSHMEIYGYMKHANPPKPFIIDVIEPSGSAYNIEFKSEDDFFKRSGLDTSSLIFLKTGQLKTIKRILSTSRHNFPLNTTLKLKYVAADD